MIIIQMVVMAYGEAIAIGIQLECLPCRDVDGRVRGAEKGSALKLADSQWRNVVQNESKKRKEQNCFVFCIDTFK